jgi:hypothetical protein
MTAQIDLDGGSEPAQVKGRFALHDECRFREIVLSSDRLQHCVWQPVGEQTNPGWIAGKEPVGKRINVVARNIHVRWGLSRRADAIETLRGVGRTRVCEFVITRQGFRWRANWCPRRDWSGWTWRGEYGESETRRVVEFEVESLRTLS